MQVSASAEFEARRGGRSVLTLDETMRRPVPLPGTLPAATAGLALDYALPDIAPVSTWALAGQQFHEGIGFFGYARLAQMAQRAEYRRPAELWAEHAVRKWVKWRGPDDDKIGRLEKRLDELNVRACFKEAAEHDGLFGRSQIFMSFSRSTESDAELNIRLTPRPGKVSQSRPLVRLKVIEPMWSYPGPYVTNDPLGEGFYKPQKWYVFGRTVDDSRLLTFVGREVPDMLKPAYAFGGLALAQMAQPYVENWLRARQSVSDMLHSYSLMILETDMSSVLQGGDGADLYRRVDIAGQMRDNRGWYVLNKDEESITNVTTPLSGLDKLQAQAQEQMSSVTGIPLVILLGVTPSGLNASSDGEVRSFYANVKAYQEKVFRPNLQRLSELVQLSLFGAIDPDIGFEFVDLWETSELERSTIQKNQADADAAHVTMGALGNEDVRANLSEDEGGRYHGIAMSGLPEPEPEPDDADAPDA